MTGKEALKKIKDLIVTSFSEEAGGQQFESGKLSDGTMIEYSKLEAGGDISIVAADGTKSPAPVANYELEDGRIVVVSEAGKIAEVKDAAAAANPAEDMAQQAAQQMAKTIKDHQAALDKFVNRIASLETAMQSFKDASSKTFTAFMDFLEADQETAITNPKQTVFSDAKEKKDAAKNKFLTAYGNFQKTVKEKAASSK